MYCKYTAEVRPANYGCNHHSLTLVFEQEGKSWTAEKHICFQDLQMKGIFDVVFEDLKKVLILEIKKKI